MHVFAGLGTRRASRALCLVVGVSALPETRGALDEALFLEFAAPALRRATGWSPPCSPPWRRRADGRRPPGIEDPALFVVVELFATTSARRGETLFGTSGSPRSGLILRMFRSMFDLLLGLKHVCTAWTRRPPPGWCAWQFDAP